MPNPTQPAGFFRDLPTGPNFERSYEVQTTVPIDGSNFSLRAFSPFVMRVLPPLILGDNLNILSVSAPSSEAGVDTSASGTDFAGAIRGLNAQRRRSSEDSYRNLVRAGTGIPGVAGATSISIEQGIANITRNQSISQTIDSANPTQIIPAVTNDATALSILLQLKQIMEIPPLVLYINPTSFTVSHTKIAQFQERSRYGYIYQAWGEELEKLSVSCTIGAFIAGKTTPSQAVASGVQYASKRDSASYQQLMAVLSMYQSGGYIQDTVSNATGRRSRANLMVGNTAIEYDQNVYVGHMDSFSYSEEETLPGGGLKFEFDFTAVKVYDQAPQRMSIAPENAPGSTFYNPSAANAPSSGSRLSRTFTGSGPTQFFTAPTVGGSTPAQPWSGAAVGTPTQTGAVIFSRR